MTVTTYEGWLADGSPWHAAPCIAAARDTFSAHGYTVYTIGNHDHLTAEPPEDHTPYSHTPWPGSQPYPEVLALDIMPGGPVDWRDLGVRIVGDKNAGKPGTEWIKYVNYTAPTGECIHASWEPHFVSTSSGDTGHIHISARTDLAGQADLHGWDPVAELLGQPSPPDPFPPNETETAMQRWPRVWQGATGQRVRYVQALLNQHGASLTVDGAFGPLTDAAVRHFQSSHNVPNSVQPDGNGDGVVGEFTLAALLDLV